MNNIELNECKVPESIGTILNNEFCVSVLSSYISSYGLVRHQLESFNNLIEEIIPSIIHETPEKHIVSREQKHTKAVIRIGQVTYQKAMIKENCGKIRPILPFECKVRGLTYALTTFIDMELLIYKAEKLIHHLMFNEIPILQLPCMVRSKYCHLYDSDKLQHENPDDHGGYFIVNGNKKVGVGQENPRKNFAFVFPLKGKKYAYELEFRSWNRRKMRSTSTLKMRITDLFDGTTPELCVDIQFISCSLSLVTVYRLLGVESIDSMLKFILCTDNLNHIEDQELHDTVQSLLYDDNSHMSIRELKEWVEKLGCKKDPSSENRITQIELIIKNEFLPHIGLDNSEATMQQKIIEFSLLVRKVILVALKKEEVSDKDNFEHKRIDCIGPMIGLLFRKYFTTVMMKLESDIREKMEKGTPIMINEIFDQKTITNNIRYAIATGNWGREKGGSAINGVVQVLNTISMMAEKSNLRRVAIQYKKTGKSAKPRLLPTSHYMIICPVETPEGAPCGLIKNLTMMCHVRVGYDPSIISDLIIMNNLVVPISKCTFEQRSKNTPIYINGLLLAYTAHPSQVVQELRNLRRLRVIVFDTTIYYSKKQNCIYVDTDSGCCSRPCFNLSQVHLIPNLIKHCPPHEIFDTLLHHGIIEYIDKFEEQEYRIAITAKQILEEQSKDPEYHLQPFTHIEIHPVCMFGVCASLIPHIEKNQAPRNTYQSAMGKQAMQSVHPDAPYRMDTTQHYIFETQVPLVQTCTESIFGFTKNPMGRNVTVLISPFEGYNCEDSMIINKSAIDRGLMRSFTNRTYTEEEKMKGSEHNRFHNPLKSNCKRIKNADHSAIENNGIPLVNARVKPKAVLIGKTNSTLETTSNTGIVITSPQKTKKQRLNESMMENVQEESAEHISPQELEARTKKQSRNKRKRKDSIQSNQENMEENQEKYLFAKLSESLCPQLLNANVERDVSLLSKSKHESVVSRIVKSINKNNFARIKLTTYEIDTPQIGDKFSSRHGQKSTIGMLYSEEDLPFDHTGQRPDIIINPHAFPGRMTIAMLYEMIDGLIACKKGVIRDATAFCSLSQEEIIDQLRSCGFNRYGTCHLTDGQTGLPMESLMFQAPCFYQRLRHMAANKIHARSTGPVSILTRQPIDGRSRDGGLRFGEMERDCLSSHGAASAIKERLFENSDPFETAVCEECGLLAVPSNRGRAAYAMKQIFNAPIDTAYCRNCNRSDTVKMVKIPYATKLMIQELYSVGVALRLRISEDIDQPSQNDHPKLVYSIKNFNNLCQ